MKHIIKLFIIIGLLLCNCVQAQNKAKPLSKKEAAVYGTIALVLGVTFVIYAYRSMNKAEDESLEKIKLKEEQREQQRLADIARSEAISERKRKKQEERNNRRKAREEQLQVAEMEKEKERIAEGIRLASYPEGYVEYYDYNFADYITYPSFRFSVEESKKWHQAGITQRMAALYRYNRFSIGTALAHEKKLKEKCGEKIYTFFDLLSMNPYDIKNKCFEFAAQPLQLLSRKTGLYKYNGKVFYLNFKHSAPNRYFGGFFYGLGEYKYTTSNNTKNIIPKLKSIIIF